MQLKVDPGVCVPQPISDMSVEVMLLCHLHAPRDISKSPLLTEQKAPVVHVRKDLWSCVSSRLALLLFSFLLLLFGYKTTRTAV